MIRSPLKSQRPSLFPALCAGARRAIIRVSIFAACALVLNALIGDNGFVDSLKTRRQHRQIADDIERLRAENSILRERSRRLRDDPRAVKEAARRQLGLIAPGEVVLIFNDAPRRPR